MIKHITPDVCYIGVNDRQKTLFENLWPLPQGVSYNSYLILDEKNVLVDTVDSCFSAIFLQKLSAALDGRHLDYIIVDHVEPDHSGSLSQILQQYPDAKIVGNKQTFGMLTGFYGITGPFYEVKEGDKLVIGKKTLSFYMAPMVHWPEVMMTYDENEGILFSADAFGTFGTLDGGVTDKELNTDKFWDEMVRYYSNIVGKYGSPVQKALQKLGGFKINMICSTHGPVWQKEISKTVGVYDKLSRFEAEKGVTIVYGSMYGHTEQIAEAIAQSLSANGVRNIVIHNASKSHISYILEDIYKYSGIIIGGNTYCNQINPSIEAVLEAIEIRDVKNRNYGYFGSFAWADGAVKRLSSFAEKMKWDNICAPIKQKQGMFDEEACDAFGKAFAAKLF